MINRREFIGITAGAGAALTLAPELLFAQAGGKLIQRAIPSSGEMLPVISFAPRPFDGPQPTAGAQLEQVLKTHLDNGGNVVDVLHGGPAGKDAARAAAAELGVMDKFFWTTPVTAVQPPKPGSGPPQPGSGPPPMLDAAAVRAQVEEKLARFKVARIELVMASAGADPTHFAVLREMKKEGRIRYIGAHWLLFPPGAPMSPYGNLEAVIQNERIDFIGTDYTTPNGAIVTFRREGTTLFVKLPGSNPEVPLSPRSEIRFGDPKSRVFEFHVDGQGRVIGALMEQGHSLSSSSASNPRARARSASGERPKTGRGGGAPRNLTASPSA